MEEKEKEQVSEDSTEWEPIHYPHHQSHHLRSSQTRHHRSSSDSQTQFIGRSTAVARDSLFTDDGGYCFVVFPPINHEGLHISPTPSPALPNHDNEKQESRKLPYLPSEDHRLGPPLPPPGALCEVGRWVRLGFELLRSKVAGIGSSVRDFATFGGTTNCSFSSATGVAVALLVWWLYVAVRRRRRRYLKVRKESRDHLILIIKEKDEKIKQLLHQIAQMNQILLALYKDSLPRTGRLTE